MECHCGPGRGGISTVDGPTCAGTGDVPAAGTAVMVRAIGMAVQRCCRTCPRGPCGFEGVCACPGVVAWVSSRTGCGPPVRADFSRELRGLYAVRVCTRRRLYVCPCAGSGYRVGPSLAVFRLPCSLRTTGVVAGPVSARPVVLCDCAAAAGAGAEGRPDERPTGAACGGHGLRLSGPPRGAAPPRPSHRCVAECSRPRRGRPGTPASSPRSADVRHALHRAPASPHASA